MPCRLASKSLLKNVWEKECPSKSIYSHDVLLLKTHTKRYISNFNRVITFTLCITHAFIRKGKNNWDLLFILWIWIWPTDVWMKFFFPRNMYHTCKHLCHLRKPSITFFSFLWFIITQTVGVHVKKNVNFWHHKRINFSSPKFRFM